MSYKNSLDTFNQSFKQLIEKYCQNTPDLNLDSLFIDRLNEDYETHIKPLEDKTKKYEAYTEKEKLMLSNLIDEYKEQINKYKKDLLKKISDINESTLLKKDAYEDECKRRLKQLDNILSEYSMDYLITNQSHEQKMHERTLAHDERKETLDYQIDNSKSNYSQVIKHFNSDLEEKNNYLHAHSSKASFKNDEEINKRIELIDKSIKAEKEHIEELKNELTLKTIQKKDTIGIQTIKLNDRIKQMTVNKNKLITDSKDTFEFTSTSFQENEQNLRKNYNDNTKIIVQDFAQTLSQIDNKIDSLYKDYERKKCLLMHDHYFENYEFERKENNLNKEHKRQIDTIKTNANSQRLVKSLERNYHKSIKLLLNNKKIIQKKHTDELKALENELNAQIEELKFEKILAENEKNYKTKKLSIVESYSHDINVIKSDITEKKYNYDITVENLRFDLKADDVNTNTVNRGKQISSEIGLLECAYTEEIETCNLHIALFEAEKKYLLDLKALQTKRATQEYNQRKSLNQLLEVLEIERNKTITEYNNDCYKTCVEKNDTELDRITEEYEIDFEHKNKLIDIEQEKTNRDKDHIISQTKIKNEKLDIEGNHHLFLVKNEYHYLIGIEKYNHYVKRYRIEKMLSKINYSTFYDSLVALSDFVKNLITHIEYNVEKNSYKFKLYMNFYVELLPLLDTFEYNFFNDFIEAQTQIIEERINFETGIKYSSLLQDLNDEHNSELLKLNEKSNSYKETIDSYTNTLESCTRTLYELENKVSFLQNEFKSKKVILEDNSKILSQIRKNNEQIKEYKEKITTITKKKKELLSSFNKLPKLIAKENNTYNKKKDKYNEEQHKEASLYYNIITSFQQIYSDYMKMNTTDIEAINNFEELKEFMHSTLVSNVEPFKEVRVKFTNLSKNYDIKLKKNFYKIIISNDKSKKAELIKEKRALFNALRLNDQILLAEETAFNHFIVNNTKQKHQAYQAEAKRKRLLEKKRKNDFNHFTSLEGINLLNFEKNFEAIDANIVAVKQSSEQKIISINQENNHANTNNYKRYEGKKAEIHLKYTEIFEKNNLVRNRIPHETNQNINEILEQNKLRNQELSQGIKDARLEYKTYSHTKNLEIDKLVKKKNKELSELDSQYKKQTNMLRHKEYKKTIYRHQRFYS